MKPRFLITILIITLLIPFFSTQAEDDCPPDPLTFAWIPKALNNPVFDLGKVGAETRIAELNEEGACPVKLLYLAPMSSTAEDQASLLEALVQLGMADGIGISCIDPEVCREPINAAIAAGIPTMTWDSDSPESERFTYLGVDNFVAGQAAADLLIRGMGESGQVAMISGVPGSANLEQRIAGFTETLSAYPDIEIVEIVYSNDLAPLAVSEVERVMSENPDLDGWFFVGLWPLLEGRGAMPQWEAATKAGHLITVAFDTLPFELELLEDGYLYGLIGQKYWGWGYDTMQILYDYILHQTDYEPFTDSGFDVVTPLNVEAMLAAWRNNDFTQTLPDPFEEAE